MSGALEGWAVLARATELAESGAEFALATVVWRQAPSSGHQGSRAIITADGSLFGWIGGACAEPIVLREAKGVIADRTPKLLLLGSSDQFGSAVPEGMVVTPISCQSEGALEIYIEPVVPAPRLVVVGSSPMAQTLVELAAALGWRSALVAVDEIGSTTVNSHSIVIVATQGHGDEDALERAVSATPAYIGLVASRKRGEAVVSYLADRGVARTLLDRVHTPVGVDLGHTNHREIAVAVLAELVQRRAAGELSDWPAHDHAQERETLPLATAAEAIDPVCQMTVSATASSYPFEHKGTTYYFCCAGCRTKFENNPAEYVEA
jgi:xanthine dehydrogenase accessory factor